MTHSDTSGENPASPSTEMTPEELLELNRRTRMRHLQSAAESIIKRTGSPPGSQAVWLSSMGQTCEMMAMWSVLMARGLVTLEEKEQCLNAAYAEFESRIGAAAGKIMIGDAVRKVLDG